MINRSYSCIVGLILICGQIIFAQKEEVVVQSGHFGKINHLSFSPDGRLLASCSEDQTLRIWHLPTGKLMATLQNPGAIASEFSPSGKQLICISLGGGLRVWNVDNSSLVKELSLGSGTDNFGRIKFAGTSIYVLTNHQLYKSSSTSFEFKQLSDDVADFQVSLDEQIKILTNDFQIKPMAGSGQRVNAFPSRKQKAGLYQMDNQAAYVFGNIAIRIQRNRMASVKQKWVIIWMMFSRRPHTVRAII